MQVVFKSPITEFCDKRGVPESMRRAFSAYTTFVLGQKYNMSSDRDTIKIMMGRLTNEQVEQIWIDFVNDFKQTLK